MSSEGLLEQTSPLENYSPVREARFGGRIMRVLKRVGARGKETTPRAIAHKDLGASARDLRVHIRQVNT
jgi:hypothetical protein